MNKKYRRYIIFFLPVVLIILIGGFFFIRAPVLLVSDQYFLDLYGKNRSLIAAIRSSASLFRRVLTVSVAEDIGPDGIAFAVSEVSANPYAVCFPYRYVDGARHYQNQFPSVKTILFAGREENLELQDQFPVVQTDSETDLYRAGFAAAIITQRQEGKILCYIENGRRATNKSFFEMGLKDGGREGDVFFLDLDDDYSYNDTISCIVITGSVDDPFITKENIPLILFSWADPSLFSSQVNLIFSDSPWEMIISTINTLKNGEELITLPSLIQIHPQHEFSFSVKKRIKTLNKMTLSADTLTKDY
jgi:hypothetical protein